MAQEWCVVDPDARTIVWPKIDWRGPVGDGDLWTANADGTTYTSNLGETSTAPAGHAQWVAPVPGPVALQSWAEGQGYTVRQFAPPPPPQDSDGDGVPDDQDADPNDPGVQ